MKANGTEFKAVKVADPPTRRRQGSARCAVHLRDGHPERTRGGEGALSHIDRQGKTWLFVDAIAGRESLKKSFPDLPEALVIPKNEPPKLIKGKD